MNDEFDLKTEADHWTSYLLASIAEGGFREAVSKMIQYYHQREWRKPPPPARDEEPITAASGRLTLSITEAARILGLSRGRAYAMARQGKLPVIRLGHKVVMPRRAMQELLSSGWKPE